MGLILWIDQNTFATSLLEKAFKKQNAPFYTLAAATDFSYLVDDLNPSVLVLDPRTILSELTTFKSQYETSEKLKTISVVWLDEELPELGFVKNVIGKISRPFDPFEIPKQLEKLLNITYN